ncbi:helix-turn-helix domain-containing protein [Leucobacter sp. M11]|uniref:helix-turn-helix domain-containing protein n=1 Tax=Leucobacter sp. M11 TaxID=2993565 RepID=UPI002D7EE323|nr:AraC family transcriptional regulator [Leucobacter sp. M11]MEB4614958.1 AraC family transcriptional regulator [Leucobacter sp. M11]
MSSPRPRTRFTNSDAPPVIHRVGSRTTISPDPIPDPFLLTTSIREQPTSARWLAHAHDTPELIWVTSGVVHVTVGGGLHVLRPARGLIIPARMTHASQVMHSARIGTTHLRQVSVPLPTPVRMGPVLPHLLQYLNDTPMPEAERLRAQRVCLDLIRSSHRHRPGLPLPDDPRIRDITRTLLRDPSDDRSLDQWAERIGTSVSTITRTFAEATGMSFVRWRRQVRVNAAMSLLLDGLPVAAAGRRVGYHSPSAFVTAFRLETGTTPGAFLKSHAAARPS